MDNYRNKKFEIPITPRTMVFCEHHKFRHLMYLGMQCILSWQVDKTGREHSRVQLCWLCGSIQAYVFMFWQLCIHRYSHCHTKHSPIIMHYCVDTGMMQFDTVQDTFNLPSSEPMQCRGSSLTNHQPCHSKAANYFITHLFRIQLKSPSVGSSTFWLRMVHTMTCWAVGTGCMHIHTCMNDWKGMSLTNNVQLVL